MTLQQLIPSDFRGCAAVSRDGRILHQAANGFADLPNERPNTIDTRFATASAGKVFVAVAILQLIESGRLSFDDTLGKLLPRDWRAIDPGVTLRQLLTHTSGVPDYFDESVMNDYEELWQYFPNYRIRQSSDLLPLFINKPMMYPAGERFQYNNTGYVLLGMVIEAVAGLPFDEHLRRCIFDPCGMADTGYFELDMLPARCAGNYIWDDRRGCFRTNIYSVDVKGTGAGGAFTTLPDIARFWDALRNHRLLSPDMTAQMMRPQAGGCYDYGLWIEDGRPHFEGCDPGVSFFSSCDVETGTVLTLVSNFGDDVWELHREMLRCL